MMGEFSIFPAEYCGRIRLANFGAEYCGRGQAQPSPPSQLARPPIQPSPAHASVASHLPNLLLTPA